MTVRTDLATFRRLSRDELDHTLQDLFGVRRPLTAELPQDGRLYGFNTLASVLDFSALHVQLMEDVVDGLISELYAAPAGNAARNAILSCDVELMGESCARAIMGPFARRAWRRPVNAEELDELVGLFAALARGGQPPRDALRGGLQAILLSPHFTHIVELTASRPRVLSPHELAARLSYFLWSTMPDEALSLAADQDRLRTRQDLEVQVTRMLASPRAARFAEDFAGAWLGIRELEAHEVDKKSFPGFEARLLPLMKQETERFFRTLLDEDRPLAELLTARFTFADALLARHYGLPVGADAKPGVLRRVELAGASRLGVLGHGSVLAETSTPTRTSPVARGEWVLDRLLCTPPPPAPADVPPLPEDPAAGDTIRERMEAHRRNPACAGCHKLMDPIGLGLETYDGVGAYREMENGTPIQTAGELPGGGAFRGLAELAPLLAQDPRLTACAAKFLLMHGVGRTITQPGDEQVLAALLQDSARATIGVKALVIRVVTSALFTSRP